MLGVKNFAVIMLLTFSTFTVAETATTVALSNDNQSHKDIIIDTAKSNLLHCDKTRGRARGGRSRPAKTDKCRGLNIESSTNVQFRIKIPLIQLIAR